MLMQVIYLFDVGLAALVAIHMSIEPIFLSCYEVGSLTNLIIKHSFINAILSRPFDLWFLLRNE